jgi:hypothetical protein
MPWHRRDGVPGEGGQSKAPVFPIHVLDKAAKRFSRLGENFSLSATQWTGSFFKDLNEVARRNSLGNPHGHLTPWALLPQIVPSDFQHD